MSGEQRPRRRAANGARPAAAPSSAAGLVALLTARFAEAGIAAPAADARWLVLGALGWTAAQLTLHGDRPLTSQQLATVQRLADRRARREPLQLLLGGTSFRGHDLTLRPGVFIPRPETELLVDLVLDALPARGVVVETCAGSGAVACAVAAERPDVRVLAIDPAPAAVELIGDNAARLGVAVDVRQGTLLGPLPDELRGRVDVVVANPPYLAAAEVADLEPEVRDWDPPEALVAGPTGHEISDALIAAAPASLRPGGTLLLEVDERRTAQTAARARAAGLVAARTHDDLTGRPRFVQAHRPR